MGAVPWGVGWRVGWRNAEQRVHQWRPRRLTLHVAHCAGNVPVNWLSLSCNMQAGSEWVLQTMLQRSRRACHACCAVARGSPLAHFQRLEPRQVASDAGWQGASEAIALQVPAARSGFGNKENGVANDVG